MTSRFDNLELADLLVQFAGLDSDLLAVKAIIEKRMVEAAKVKVGKIYFIGTPTGRIWPQEARYHGRTILVESLRAKFDRHNSGWELLAQGPLGKRQAGGVKAAKGAPDIYGGRYVDVLASRLWLSTESPRP